MKNCSKVVLMSLGVFLMLAFQVHAQPEVKPVVKNKVLFYASDRRPGVDVRAVVKPVVKNKVLFSDDTKQAVSAFDEMMRGKQDEWDELVVLLHYYPKRYAVLMTGLNERQRQQMDLQDPHPYRLYSEYLYKRTEESQAFARKSALSWKVGWDLTCSDMLPKLLQSGFPSTRRIALEFLKMENNGETFGYDWKPEPNAKDPAIQKWEVWINQHKNEKKE